MIYGYCNLCPSRPYNDAAAMAPCCMNKICDRCLCTYLTSFDANNLPLTCPFGCNNELGHHFIEERPQDHNRNFLRLKDIFQSMVTG